MRTVLMVAAVAFVAAATFLAYYVHTISSAAVAVLELSEGAM